MLSAMSRFNLGSMAENFRSNVDISPWDKSGSSAFGLRRENAKFLALAFITFGLLLADPPFSIFPTDFLNIYVGNWISSMFNVSSLTGLVLSYTLVAWGLIFVGAWIYPYNTTLLLNGYRNKAKAYIKRQIKNPIVVLISLIIFYYMFKLYSGWLA